MNDFPSIIKIQCEVLCDWLPHGEDQAISIEDLSERLGIMPCHTFLLIHEAQRLGFQVLETYKGVFIPKTKKEKEMYKYYIAAIIGGRSDHAE